jgi:uncharacterized protein (DUF1810 family)
MKQVDELERFLQAQEGVFEEALQEIKQGRKRTHWMWFIFPQVEGLGSSATAHYYAIKSKEEARQYLSHPVLGKRLRECAQALLDLPDHTTAVGVFGFPDVLKLRSSMTLFAEVSEEKDNVFAQVLERFYTVKRMRKL